MSYWPQQRHQQQLIQGQQEYQQREHQRRCQEQEELKAEQEELKAQLAQLSGELCFLRQQGLQGKFEYDKLQGRYNCLEQYATHLFDEHSEAHKFRVQWEKENKVLPKLIQEAKDTCVALRRELELGLFSKRQKNSADHQTQGETPVQPPVQPLVQPLVQPAPKKKTAPKTAPKKKTAPKTVPKKKTAPKTAPKEKAAPKSPGFKKALKKGYRESEVDALKHTPDGTEETNPRLLQTFAEDFKSAQIALEERRQGKKEKEMEKQSTCVFDGLDLSESTHLEPATTNVVKLSMLAYAAWSSWKTFQPEDTLTFAVIVSLSAIMLLSVVCPRRLWKPTNIGKRVRFVHVYTMACCITVLLRTLAWSQSEPATKPAPNQSYTPGTAKLEYEEYIKNLDYNADRALDTDPILHVVGVTLFLCAMITLEAMGLSFTKVSSEIENSGANPSVLRKSTQFLYKCPHKSPHGERTFVSINKNVLLITLFFIFIFYDYPMVTTHAAPKPLQELDILHKIGTSSGFQVLTHDQAEECANWKYHDYFSPTAKSGERKKGPSKFDPTTPKRQNMCLAHITRCTTLKGEWSFEELRCAGDPNNKNWSPSHQQDARKQKEDSGLFFEHMSELDQNITFENHKASCKMSNKWKASMLILIIVVIHLEFYSKKPIDPEEEWAKWATNPITLCCVFIGVTFVAFLPLKGYAIVGIAKVSLEYLAMVGMIIMLCKAPKEWRNTLLVVISVLLLCFWADSKFQELIKHVQGLPYSVFSKLAAMFKRKP